MVFDAKAARMATNEVARGIGMYADNAMDRVFARIKQEAMSGDDECTFHIYKRRGVKTIEFDDKARISLGAFIDNIKKHGYNVVDTMDFSDGDGLITIGW